MPDQPATAESTAAILASVIEAAVKASPPTSSPQTTPASPTPAPRTPPTMSFADFLSLGSKPQPRVTMPPDPGLPHDLLPPHIAEWLAATAVLAGVPPVMIALPFLGATGGVIGNRLALRLHAGWTEYPTLWVALVALTGARKTPAIAAARLPFDALHDELHAAWSATEPLIPSVPLITPEATWSRLHQHLDLARGLILYRDELTGLLTAINGRRGEDRQRYLSLWSADPLHQTGRPTIHHPVVSIVGGIQPLLLIRLRHREPDGLLERFIPVLAGGKSTPWNPHLPTDRPPLEPVLDVLRPLHHHTPSEVPLSPAAEALWTTWYNAQLELTHPSPLVIGGFYRKYPTQLARLALVLHALWHPQDPAQPLHQDTMDRAITLMEYLRIQLHRTIFFINERHPVRSPADLLTDRIRETLASHHPEWLGHTRLARQLGRPPSSVLTTALQTLETGGHIESRLVNNPGRGRPGLQYRHLRSSDSRTKSQQFAPNLPENPHEMNES